jgi:hypothetical protein
VAAHLYLVQLAIPAALEPEFNRLYDEGYVPALLKVPGVVACARYKLEWADTPDMPEHLTTYEITDPEVSKSAAWRQASIDCGWAERIRPHLTVRRHGMFRRLA